MSSSSESDSPPSRAQVQRWLENSRHEIEGICHQIIGAINDGRFDTNDPIWRVTMPNFEAAAAFALFPKFCDLATLLRTYRKHKQNYPHYAIRLNDDILIKIDERKRIARAHVNILSEGIPDGQVRQSVAQMDFVYLKGAWYCQRYQCMPGMQAASCY